MNIEISKQGFISDAAYSFYLSSLVQEYEDKFPLLEVLKVIIKELCLSPLNDWTVFKNQFRTLNLGNYEYKT